MWWNEWENKIELSQEDIDLNNNVKELIKFYDYIQDELDEERYKFYPVGNENTQVIYPEEVCPRRLDQHEAKTAAQNGNSS